MSHKTHRPHIKVGKEEENQKNKFDVYLIYCGGMRSWFKLGCYNQLINKSTKYVIGANRFYHIFQVGNAQQISFFSGII